jgi:hypothetical protein
LYGRETTYLTQGATFLLAANMYLHHLNYNPMNKLYEVLAVEQDRKQKANIELGRLRKSFEKQDEMFDGLTKRYVPLEENAEHIPDENKEMVMTVDQALKLSQDTFAKGFHAILQKEETNASGTARAELKVGDKSFGKLAATSLLAIESQLLKLRELYQVLPTLDAAKRWEMDDQLGHYVTEPEVKFRSIKRPKVVVKYEATKEHPAQTELLNLDIQVGRYETVYTSGKISRSRKNELLGRLNELLEAVKVARAKANTAEVVKVKVVDQLLDYINA